MTTTDIQCFLGIPKPINRMYASLVSKHAPYSSHGTPFLPNQITKANVRGFSASLLLHPLASIEGAAPGVACCLKPTFATAPDADDESRSTMFDRSERSVGVL